MVQITSYAIFFILATMVGWIIDSFYRSVVTRRWINAGYFIGPFCPIYGFGGILLLVMVSRFGDEPFLVRCLIYFMGMTGVEFFGGLFSTYVLKVKLWDYSDAPLNIMGHVDLLHSFYWLLLALGFEGLVWPIVNFINENARLVLWVDRVVFILFIVSFSFALFWKMVKERARVKPFIKEGAPKVLWKHMDRMNDRYVELMERLDEGVVTPSETATREWFDEHEYFLEEVHEKVESLKRDSARIRSSVPASRMEKDLGRISSLLKKRRNELAELRKKEKEVLPGSQEIKDFTDSLDKVKERYRENVKRTSPILQWRSYIKRRGRSFHPKAFFDRFPAWQKGWQKRKEDLMTLLRSDNG